MQRIKEMIARLVEKYKYRQLPVELSQRVRNTYMAYCPDFLSFSGSDDIIRTKLGTPISNGYNRIVVGDYGAYIEFGEPFREDLFTVQPGQEYRINDERYANNVKYEWYTIKDGSEIKIYKQKREVSYADYKAGMYYVSVFDVI